MLPGSGVVPVVVVVLFAVPKIVKDSEGIVPTEFCDACDGPGLSSLQRVAHVLEVRQSQPVPAGIQVYRAEAARLGANVKAKLVGVAVAYGEVDHAVEVRGAANSDEVMESSRNEFGRRGTATHRSSFR